MADFLKEGDNPVSYPGKHLIIGLPLTVRKHVYTHLTKN